jgi:hypothetical protein
MSGDRCERKNPTIGHDITETAKRSIETTPGKKQNRGMQMISRAIRTAIATAIFAGGSALAPAALAQTAIGVSYQPSLYWALPFHYANVKGWWKEVGLTPTFSTFPAGAPQIAAS